MHAAAEDCRPLDAHQLHDVVTAVLEDFILDLIELRRRHLWDRCPTELVGVKPAHTKLLEIGDLVITSPLLIRKFMAAQQTLAHIDTLLDRINGLFGTDITLGMITSGCIPRSETEGSAVKRVLEEGSLRPVPTEPSWTRCRK